MTVANVKPSIVLTGAATADEGDTNTYSFTVTDPGATPTRSRPRAAPTATKVAGSDTFDAGTGAGSFECFFADGPATTNVTATVTDSDGASDTDNQVVIVTVANVAPTVTLTGDATVNEGSQHTYSFTTTDPGADTFVLDATDCGTGGTQVGPDTFNTDDGCGQLRLLVPGRAGQPRRSASRSVTPTGRRTATPLAVTVDQRRARR